MFENLNPQIVASMVAPVGAPNVMQLTTMYEFTHTNRQLFAHLGQFDLLVNHGANVVLGASGTYIPGAIITAGKAVSIPSTWVSFFSINLGTDLHALRSVIGGRMGVVATAADVQVQNLHTAKGTTLSNPRNVEPCR